MNHRQNRLAAGFWGRWVVFALVVSALTARAAIVSVGDFTALTNAISTGATGDTILLTNNITLSAELSVSAKGLTFEGNRYSISVPTPGLNESGVVNASPSVMRVFNINAIGKTNTIRNLLVKGGSPGASGGGILNTNGTLVLEGVTVTQSGGSSAGGGGLVNSSGMLFMRDCNISRNGAKHGGGFLNSGTLVMERCTFSENRSMSTMGGGGAGENQAQLYANNCTFANNKSTELGGAINNNNGTAFFVNCTFVGNIAYGIFQGGAIACNNGNVTLVNSLLAYNYRNNAGVYELNDIVKYSGNAPVAYSCIFQSTTSQLSASSTGVSLYPGNATGSDDSLFCAGATAKVLGPDGTQVGSGTIYQPFLAQTGLTPATVLKTNSFAFGKGVLTGFSSATLPAVVGFYNGSSWTTLSGSNPAGCEVTAGQDGNLIGVPLTAGSVNSTAASLFMLKVNSAAHGSVSGGTIYGDVYASGTTVTLTAIPDPGYAFTEWDYVLGGSGVASTANPFALTLASDVTLLPVFSLYNGFTVSYSGNGSTGGAVPSAQVIPLAGSATLAGAGAMVRSGYTFSGWNSRYDGNGTDFAPGATYNGPVNLSLYAKWALVPSPTITASPGSQTVAAGGTASLSVHATGDYPLTYQWFKNNAILPGATNSTLALANAAVTNSGVYYVVVTNVHGMSISWPAAVSAGMPQLMAWGWNDNGQLGDGTILTRSNAITVATNVVAAAGGYQHSLFVKGDGTLWTMGYNGVNQLGDGTSTERHSPVPVASNAVAVAAGSSHSLFIKDDGTLWAMGYNNAGQLGNGTLNEQSNAVAVIGGSNVVAVSAGFHHTLFLKGDGTLWGMGENDCGQLGDGTQVNSQAPKSVASNVVAVVAGRAHSLFIKRDLTLWAMGTNNSGQLGDGSTTLRTSPVCVASNVLAAAAGQYHSVYLKSDASLWAVGDNAYGQLGNLTKTDQILAVAVAGGTNVVAVAAGRYDSLFMKADNTLWTVGWNGHGELGDGGTSGSRSNAVAIPGMTLAGVSAGSSAYQAFAVGMPVAITTQPANQSVVATSNATFSVTATGIATVGYQWQLNGTNIAGATAASYTRTAAMAATAGNYTVAVSNLYGSITSSAAVLTVTKATPAVTAWPLASAITYGQTLASSVLSGGSAAVAGSFAFSTPSTAPAAGAASQGVVFTPADTANYNTVSGSVSVTVGKATPSVTVWPAASAITYGQTLASSSLSGGSAVVAGSFAFTTPSTAPGVGTASQAVVFNPTDTTDYNSVTGSVNVTVMKAPASVVFVESSLLAVYDGTAKAPASATTPGGLAVSLTYNGSSASPTNAGTYTVVGTISDAVYQGSVTSQFRIAMSGPAVAWGAGADYQLGNNAGTNSPFPVEVLASGVLAGKTIVAVAAGRYTSYALTSEGLVYAWGRNNAGQLGDGGSPVLDSQVPVMVSTNGALSGKRIVSIIASELGAMALSADAKLFTWGWNYRGALGNGSEVTWTNVPVAVDMSGALAGKTVAALGAGNAHYLVATSDGKVFGWGDGGYGQLGQGGSTASSTPVAVNMSGVLAGKTVVAVAGGWQHSMALTADGLVYAWGGGGSGQLGNGASTNSYLPVAVSTSGVLAGKTITAISAGEYHSLAASSEGRAYAWGGGSSGELGNGAAAQSNVPVAVATNAALLGKRVVSVCATFSSSLALTDDGQVFSWGANARGDLGCGSYGTRLVPVAVYTAGALAGRTVLAIASSAQSYHVMAVTVGLSAPALTSATNASGVYGQSFSFTVAGNQIQARSASGLPGWLAFDTGTGVFSGTPSSYGLWNITVIVTNVFGSTTGSVALRVAHAPVAVSDAMGAVQDQPVEVAAGRLALNDTDEDGNPVTVTAVSDTSTAGGTVELVDGTLTYHPPPGVIGGDTFTYSLSDAYGNTVTGTVLVTIASSTGVSLNVVYHPVVDPETEEFVVRFAGTPGAVYTLEWTADLALPDWQPVMMVEVPADNSLGFGEGVWEYREPTDGATSRFYRTVYPAYNPVIVNQ